MTNRLDDDLKSSVKGLTRREVVQQTAGASALAAAGLASRSVAVSAQGYATTVGVADGGALSIEFVGSIHQRAFDFTVFGFLTYVAGLDPAILFTDDDVINRSAGAARLTLHGTGKGTSRTIHETLFLVDAVGEIGLYYSDEGGATFEEPDSFETGEKVATMLMRIQNVVNVTAPKSGLCTGYGDLTFDETSSFEAGGDSYEVGSTGALARLSYSGAGTLIDPELPEAILSIAGNFRF